MKKIILLVLLITAFSGSIWAQTSVLRVSLSDESPLTVAINGRQYNKHGRSLTIGDLPPGRHHIRVYAYTPYKENGGRANLVYSGTIRLERGTFNDAIVDGYRSKLRMSSQSLEDNIVTYQEDGGDNTVRNEGGRNNVFTTRDMDDLKQRSGDRITDTDKLKLIKSALNGRTYNSAQVAEMLEWLSFDSSKLDLAKWAYSNVTDKQNYWKLDSAFSFDSSKDELNEYLSHSK